MRHIPEYPSPKSLEMIPLPPTQEDKTILRDRKKDKVQRKSRQRNRPDIPPHEQDAVATVIICLDQALLSHRHRFLMIDQGMRLIIDPIPLPFDLLTPVQLLII